MEVGSEQQSLTPLPRHLWHPWHPRHPLHPSCVPGGLILSAGIANGEQRGPPRSSNVSLGPPGFPQGPIRILYLSSTHPVPILYLSCTYPTYPLPILYLSYTYILYLSYTYPIPILYLSYTYHIPILSYTYPIPILYLSLTRPG